MTVEWLSIVDPSGVELSLTAGPYRVLPGPSGRMMPPVRRSVDELADAPGGVLRSVTHGVRQVLLPMLVTGDSDVECRNRVRDLAVLLDPTRGDLTMRAVGPDGAARELSARYTGGMELDEGTGNEVGALFVAQFEAVDPYWRDETETVVTLTASATASGFFPFFPLRLGSSEVLAVASLENVGDVDAWPVFTCRGPFTSLALYSDEPVGGALVLATSVAAGAFVTIDARPDRSTVTDADGVNLYPALTSDSWWPLHRGVNQVRVEGSGLAVGVTSVEVAWHSRYLTA